MYLCRVQMFVYTGKLRFKVVQRKDMERQVLVARRSMHDHQSPTPGSPVGDGYANGHGSDNLLRDGNNRGQGAPDLRTDPPLPLWLSKDDGILVAVISVTDKQSRRQDTKC